VRRDFAPFGGQGASWLLGARALQVARACSRAAHTAGAVIRPCSLWRQQSGAAWPAARSRRPL